MKKDLVAALVDASNAPGTALAPAALVIARVEYPRLDPEPYIARLDAMGDAARRVIERHASSSGDMSAQCGVKALNEYLFEELRFHGQSRQVRGSAQQLPQRGARAADRHPADALDRLHGGGAARRAAGGRHQLPRPLPRALPAGAVRGTSWSSIRSIAARCCRNTTAGCCCRNTSAARWRSADRCWRRRRAARSSCGCCST